MAFIIIASGGQGGTYLRIRLKAHKRPDLAFYPRCGISCINLKSSSKPTAKQQAIFLKRTFGWYTLELDKTIKDNMIQYLICINANGAKNVVLAGSLSLMGSFFKMEKIENVYCLIRHPVNAMVALLVVRHKRHAMRYGGINTEACIDDYASLWNSIAGDVIEGKVKIIRHEYATQDARTIKDAEIRKVFEGLYSDERFPGVLESKFEQQLKELTADNYFKIYDKWEI